ncbi:Germacrene-D synthase [Forsythia ovata]|uniref:Germacrene-D synthase n=1 Tax=Forsythia ovata TaxID=205694 RepID=A0ABD1S8V1_9LAMI
MSIQICALAAPISTKNVGIENARRSVTYHPSVWGDYFLEYTSDLTDILTHEEQEHQILKEEVNKLLAATPDDFAHKLDLVDSIQRLGVGVFDKFKDKQGKFDESLVSNVQGLLSLYEAAQFRVHGEETLEEALTFSITHLNSLILQVSNSLSGQIREALEMPIHKTLTRLGARRFLSIYQQDESQNDILLNFAKLDFNLLQKMHQKELYNITRAYFEEAKWAYNGYLPIDMEEYMKVAVTSSGYIMLSTTCLVGMGELVTKEAFDWISSESIAVKGSAIIARLMDDMAGHGVTSLNSII